MKDIDFDSGTITILHLKSRVKLSCPKCGKRLGRSHAFCPGCGLKVEKALVQEQERHRMRTLPIDEDTLRMLSEYIRRGGPVSQRARWSSLASIDIEPGR